MKVIKYFFVGGIAASVDIGIFFIFAKLLGFHYMPVGISSFTLATLVNYLFSTRYVFVSEIRFSKKAEVLLVYVFSSLALLINQFVLYLCIDVIMLEIMLSKLIATGSVFFFNFFARNNFIFKEKN